MVVFGSGVLTTTPWEGSRNFQIITLCCTFKIFLKMSLLESATLVEQTTPLKSSSLPCDAYVLAIAAFGSYYAASASAPSHRIYLFDKTSLGTSHSFEGHREGTTSLRGVDSIAGTNRRAIVSSGRDGVVRAWDDRTGTAAIEST